MKTHGFVVLGAGPTGLGAAWRLQELGTEDWVVIEASDHPGGLASSFTDDAGFTWDIGGHVLFSHYHYFDRAMDEFLGYDGWLVHERESWVWMRDRFIPYPLQNNIHRLPPADLYRCLAGLVDIVRQPSPPPDNFHAWLLATFGQGITDVFLEPYNLKVWGYSPERLSAGWVGERVAVTDLKRVLHNLVFNKDDVSWGPNNTFRFPLRGGTGSVWRACAKRLPQDRLRLNSRVVAIDLNRRTVTTEGGETIVYDSLISTIPLLELVRLSEEKQFDVAAKRGLLYSSSNIVGIGLRGQPPERLRTKCWMYFPESNCPFYRVTVFSNYSPNNVPDMHRNWSLMAEVSESPLKPVNHATLSREVVDGLLATHLIARREDIVSLWQYRVEYGYPVPALERDAVVDAIVAFFEARGVFPRGRFGLWKYEVGNQDHSFMQGIEVVERLLAGRAEVTAWNPNLANSKKHEWPFDVWD